MASAASIRNKLDNLLRKVGPRTRTVYKRTLTVSGNTLVGRQTTVSADVLMNPQPTFTEINDKMVIANGKNVRVGDYSFTMSPTSITLDELQSLNLQLVLKDASGATEVLRIIGFTNPEFKGEAVAFTVHAARLTS